MNAAAAVPHLKVPGRTREAPYGAAEALLAGAVVVFFTMIGCLMLPDGLWWGEHREVVSRAFVTTDGTYDTPMGRAYAVTVLLLVQVGLLAAVWQCRRPRFAVAPTERVSELPAVATLWLGATSFVMIPTWLALGGGGSSSGPTFFVAALAITGTVLVALGLSRMPRSRGLRQRHAGHATGTDGSAHAHGGLATPNSAFDALREGQAGFSYQGIRRKAELQESRPVGFSLTRAPDHSLAPSAMGVGLLGLLSLLIALPAVMLTLRSLVS